MAVGFLLGLSGPRSWSVPLSWYILGSQTPCAISDVPIHEVKAKLKVTSNVEPQEMLNIILEDFDQHFEAGYNKIDIKFEDKNDVIETVIRYFVITRQLEEINQLSKRCWRTKHPSEFETLQGWNDQGVYSICKQAYL